MQALIFDVNGTRGVVGERVALGLGSFGESAPAEALYQHLGLTLALVGGAARALLEDQP